MYLVVLVLYLLEFGAVAFVVIRIFCFSSVDSGAKMLLIFLSVITMSGITALSLKVLSSSLVFSWFSKCVACSDSAIVCGSVTEFSPIISSLILFGFCFLL